MTVLCQWCGAPNPDDRELCLRCNSKLLVFSGWQEPGGGELEDEEEILEREGVAFDEHLLERLSASEEAIKKAQSLLIRMEERLGELERGVALLDAGVQALVDLLDRRRVVRETEVMAAWERAATSDMAREELLERLRERREVIVSRARTVGASAETACARALQSAELSLLAGQQGRAAEVLAEALRRAPRNPELAGLLGEISFEQGDLVAAENYFRQTVRWDPNAVEPRVFLGTILADAGKDREAREQLEHAAKLAPDSFLPQFSLGALHASAGRPVEARRHLQLSLRREEIPQAHFLLGLVELEAGRPGAAASSLERALLLEPEFEDAIYYLGLAYLERGWNRRALECFRRVLEIDPQRLRYQEAVRLIEGGGEAVPPLPGEAELLVKEASEAAEGGDLERARSLVQRAMRLADHPGLLASLALLAAAVGNHREALAAAHRLLRQGVSGAPLLAAWTALLETLRAARRFGAVERWAGELLEHGAGPLERAIAGYELALTELERGRDFTRALELAHGSLSLIPREMRQFPLAALGRIHLARGEYADAVDYLEQAAELAPAPATLTQLGLALLEQGQDEKAREVLQRARRAGGRDLKTDVLTHLARVGWLPRHGRRKG